MFIPVSRHFNGPRARKDARMETTISQTYDCHITITYSFAWRRRQKVGEARVGDNRRWSIRQNLWDILQGIEVSSPPILDSLSFSFLFSAQVLPVFVLLLLHYCICTSLASISHMFNGRWHLDEKWVFLVSLTLFIFLSLLQSFLFSHCFFLLLFSWWVSPQLSFRAHYYYQTVHRPTCFLFCHWEQKLGFGVTAAVAGFCVAFSSSYC